MLRLWKGSMKSEDERDRKREWRLRKREQEGGCVFLHRCVVCGREVLATEAVPHNSGQLLPALTLPGPERWGGGLGLNYRVHMWQIYRYKKGKKSEFRQIEWKKDSKILACCWLRVFCVHFFKGVVSPEEIGISQSENPDSEFEGLGDYEESFVAEWWQEPKTKWDTGEVTDWHLSLSPVQNASSSSSVPPRQHTKGCWPPYRQTFPTVFSRKSTTHSCVFSTSNLSIMLIEIRDWHILSWLSSAF